jgi:L-malate glycosyltransferase
VNKLLIITSEELNPDNIFTSTFELSQAQILSQEAEVAILSVKAYDSFSAKLKQILKKSLGYPSIQKAHTFKSLFAELKEMLSFLLGKKKITKKHCIEGVAVYEGIGYFFISSSDFQHNLDVWTKAGYCAFDSFCKDKGAPDIIHAHGRFLNAGVLALAIKKKDKIPYLYTEHSTFFQRNIAPAAAKPILEDVINNAAFFTAVSLSLVNQVSKFLDRPLTDAIIIPNTIDKIFEDPLSNKLRSDGSIIFLTVASLDYKKGIDVLLKSFNKAFSGTSKKHLLKIAGEGPLQAELQKLRDDLGLKDSVQFLGPQSKYAVKKLMDESNVFVLPSRVETFGVVVIEALARGCPVIATRSGGPENIVTDECGIIVEAGIEEELAEALKKMTNNHIIYNRADIRSYAINKYGNKTFLSAMNKLYDRVLCQQLN